MESKKLNAITEFFLEERKDPFGGTIGREWSKPDFMLRFISDRTPNDLYLVNCTLEKTPSYKGERCGRIWFYSIHYVVSGHGWFEYDGEKSYLGKGDVFIVSPNIEIAYSPDPDNPWEYINVDIYGNLATFVNLIIGNPKRLVFHADRESGLEEDFFRLVKTVFKKGRKSFQATGLLFLLLDKLENLFGRKEESKNDGLNEYVRYALDYIRCNYPNLTIKDIAKSCYVSPEYLSRLCKRETGYTLKELLTIYRLQLSLDYLRNSFLNESEIAGLVGYSSGKYFKAVFYSVFGESPEEYRRESGIIKSKE